MIGTDRYSGGGHPVGGYIENRGKDLFDLAKARGMEGIYRSAQEEHISARPAFLDWLKIKSRPQQEFIACGFTKGKGSRKHFGASLLGAYRNGKLRYFGSFRNRLH
jgi:bifunctional non-homologous end joining protein LigD